MSLYIRHNLFDIIEIEKWQLLQNRFARALGVTIQTVNRDGQSFSRINTPSYFCSEVMSRSKVVKKLCEECATRLVCNIKKDADSNEYSCLSGLYIYGIPLRIDDEELAYLIVGPVLLHKRRDEREYRKFSEEAEVPLDKLIDGLRFIKSFTFIGIKSILELLEDVSNHIIQLSYQRKKLVEKYGVPREVDKVIKEVYSSVYFDELLGALLDSALHTTKADSGSIMLLDPDSEELSIKFSQGLKEEIVKTTRVAFGKGISGIVAEERKPILVDDSMEDARIRRLLKRPQLKSSIVFPLQIRNRIIGVVNVSTMKEDRRFTQETVDLLGQLVRLSGVALSCFPLSRSIA